MFHLFSDMMDGSTLKIHFLWEGLRLSCFHYCGPLGQLYAYQCHCRQQDHINWSTVSYTTCWKWCWKQMWFSPPVMKSALSHLTTQSRKRVLLFRKMTKGKQITVKLKILWNAVLCFVALNHITFGMMANSAWTIVAKQTWNWPRAAANEATEVAYFLQRQQSM